MGETGKRALRVKFDGKSQMNIVQGSWTLGKIKTIIRNNDLWISPNKPCQFKCGDIYFKKVVILGELII